MIDSPTSLGGPHRLKACLALLAAVAGLLWLAAPAGAGIQTINANGGTLGAIPDGTGTAATGCPDASSLNVTFTVAGFDPDDQITEVGVGFTLGTPHTHVGDLEVELFAPNGDSHVIFSRTGATDTGAGDTSDLAGPYGFADTALSTANWWAAAGPPGGGSPVPSGTYRASTSGGDPSGGQNTFITPSFSGVTNPNGTWTLRFSDCAVNDTGSVTAAMLTINVPAPPNDNFANSVGLFGSSVSVSGNNRNATDTEPGEPSYTTPDGLMVSSTAPTVTRSVWYSWTAPGSGPASVDTCGNPGDPVFDSMLAVFTGSLPGPLTTVGSNNNSADCPGGSFRSKVSFTAVQGTTYRILVDGCCGAPAGDFRLSLSGPAGSLLPFTPEGSAPAAAKPSNDLTLGKLKLNEDNGTATLKVAVPGEGKLSLAGKGLVKQRMAARVGSLGRQVFGAGKFKLTIKAKGAKKAKLNDEGEVNVKAKVTFKPTGGTSASDTKKITLKKD